MVDAGSGVRTRRIIRGIVMFYVIVGFPLLLTYALLVWFTALRGKVLLTSMLPVAVVLLTLFAIYLLRPIRFKRFWNSNNKD